MICIKVANNFLREKKRRVAKTGIFKVEERKNKLYHFKGFISHFFDVPTAMIAMLSAHSYYFILLFNTNGKMERN